jgi:hypothetical protein
MNKRKPIASRSVKGLVSLALKADLLDLNELSVAKYLLKLADWYKTDEYKLAKKRRMDNKRKYQ